MDKWALIHNYRRAVANDEALPILCPDCNYELAVQVGTDGEPALRCFSCRSVITPGLHVWDQIKKVLNDD